jgi:hypothetical protein
MKKGKQVIFQGELDIFVSEEKLNFQLKLDFCPHLKQRTFFDGFKITT